MRLKPKLFKSSPDRRIWQARVKFSGHSLDVSFRTEDIFILYELFQSDPYFSEQMLKNPPKCIVDLGAHIGLATLQFRIRFPYAIIHSYEPGPRKLFFSFKKYQQQGRNFSSSTSSGTGYWQRGAICPDQ